MDDHQEIIKALGISRAKNNYINQLWELHCRDIVGVKLMATDFEDAIDELEEEGPSSLAVEHPLSAILETINSEPESLNSREANERYLWLEEKLMALRRLKSDVELRLRNASSSITENNAIQ
jgi:hypothetical protein